MFLLHKSCVFLQVDIMNNGKTYPRRPPRINAFAEHPVYFITFNTHNRQDLLANNKTHSRFVNFAKKATAHGAAVGRYVIMPDHIHLFLRSHHSLKIGDTVRLLKRSLSASIQSPSPHWQPGFFDHILRKEESYSEKWHYVHLNPVRANLVEKAEDWEFQGEIVRLTM
jgi:putative transposase